MQQEIEGDDCEMKEHPELTLWPISIRSCRSHGCKVHLYPHLSEGFKGDWLINKSCHYFWGMQFTWATNCYAIQFILSYDGNSPVIQCLQMWLMLLNMVVIHCNNSWLIDSDKWLCLGEAFCFNPLLHQYNKILLDLHKSNPPPTGVTKPKNMSNYLKLCQSKQSLDSSQQHTHFAKANSFFLQATGKVHAAMYHNPLVVIPCQFINSDKTQQNLG